MTNFPTSLDTFTDPNPTDPRNAPSHAAQHDLENDAILALETKVGINSSGVTTSLDYIVRHLIGGSLDAAPADIYIATTGDDTTGSGTGGNPYKTLAKALSVLPVILGVPHTIHVADGTYAEPVT